MPGLLGKKVGMTHLFGERGRIVPVTVIQAGPCVVTQLRTLPLDGYQAVQVGYGEARQLTKPKLGHLKGLGKLRHLREFRTGDPSSYEVGQKLDVTLFEEGEVVNVTSRSKGRGFQGTVRRHGFAGGPKTHGQKDRHRAPGSIGGTTFPGRVMKGKKMAGHMGNRQVTVRGLKVERVDTDRNLLLIRGAVPGARNQLLSVRSAKRG
jgi:large subunit ribosomal protein L3